MKICKNCGEVNQNDTQFCCNCGKGSFVFSEETVCQHCGAANDKNYVHCINCGNELSVVSALTSQQHDDNEEGLQYYDDGGRIAPIQKETAKCGHCGAEIQINSIYCYKCGESVSRLHDHRVVGRKICGFCATPNLVENPYCSYCYSTLADAKSEEFQVCHELVQIGGITTKRALLQGDRGRYKICNNCGSLNKQDVDFCIQCGLSLMLEEQKKFCPNCGTVNTTDAQFCSKCQWSFEGQMPESEKQLWSCEACNHLNENQSEFCNYCGLKKK